MPSAPPYLAPTYFAPTYFPESYFGSTGTGPAPVVPDAYTPFYPPIEPYVLPSAPFEGLINAYGVDLIWKKNHACPCVWGGQQQGSPDPACETCQGRGYYWDTPSSVFRGLITFIHMSPTPDEPGSQMDTKYGLLNNGDPALTVTNKTPLVWKEASEFDQFVEVNSISRFNSKLVVGQRTQLVYTESLTVASAGAVSVYNAETRQVEFPSSYTVTGSNVVLTGYPPLTPYIVEFIAATTYVSFRIAGSLPHVRPFGNVSEPRRFRLKALDLWLREQGPSSS